MSIFSVSLLVVFLAALVSAQGESSPYAPTVVQCPSGLQVRSARGGLSSQEQQWRQQRLGEVVKSLSSYLKTANIPGFNVSAYLGQVNASSAPVAGLAISGGGSQSGMGGLGLWQAFDARYPAAVKAGTGGLTQCLSYLTGLSGGGLNTVIPLASNNFSSLADLRVDVNLTADFTVGPGGNQTAHIESAFENTYFKHLAGFAVSVTDVFGQFYRQYLPPSWGYKGFSDVAAANSSFSKGLAPMPIIALSEVVPGSSPNVSGILYPGVNSTNLTVYEQTPFEFGNWVGGRVQAFMPTKFLGTMMNNGTPANSNHCVNGFDKLTFAQGSTGNAYNFWFIDAFYNVALFYKRSRIYRLLDRDSTPPSSSIVIPPGQSANPLVQLVNQTANVFNQTFNESMWAWYPNPFRNHNKKMTGVSELLIVDGSETGETIPLRPLIVPQRKVDFIVAFDASGENPNNGWVNGTTFGMSAASAKLLGLPFPEVPDAATFVNLGLNRYPTFFGCNANASTPLVLYVPNAPWSAYSNYSYTMSKFTDEQLDLVFNNSLNMVTFGQGQLANVTTGSPPASAGAAPPPFPACIACGLVYKSLQRVGETVPDACKACFSAHCWNGTRASAPPPPYNPTLFLESGVGYQTWNQTVWINPRWSRYYAPGGEIFEYLKDVAHKYDVEKYVRFRHFFQRAEWKEEEQKWHITLKDLVNETTVTDTADILLKGTGILNRWKWPDIEGLRTFKGTVLHSARWDPSFDWTDKAVALIGGGSSGIQILPQIQPKAKHVYHYMKGKTWISPVGYGFEEGVEDNAEHPPTQREHFAANPAEYLVYRHHVESIMNKAQVATFTGSDIQRLFWDMADLNMREKLKTKPWIYESLKPSFPPGCRRLTPGPGYLEALCEENVDFIGTGITRVTETGILDQNGDFHEVDAIICATGFDYSMNEESTPIIGRGGTTLAQQWDPFPQAYMSVSVPKMPNLFLLIGPNGGPAGGSFIGMLEYVVEYVIKCVQKMQREYIGAMEVTSRAHDAFSAHVDTYFEKTVFSHQCKSWFKRNMTTGRVVALWPGSSVHARAILASPRFEDFTYDLRTETGGDPLAFFGNGLSVSQERDEKTTTYLDEVDVPPVINHGVRPRSSNAVPTSTQGPAAWAKEMEMNGEFWKMRDAVGGFPL